jgi:hypothetical protein
MRAELRHHGSESCGRFVSDSLHCLPHYLRIHSLAGGGIQPYLFRHSPPRLGLLGLPSGLDELCDVLVYQLPYAA